MLGFLLGYILGSPTIYIKKQTKTIPLTKAQRKKIMKKIKHDKTCPNLSKSVTNRSETNYLFY